jgi:hypothetical protein
LRTQQNIDGGFGDSGSTAYETGVALEALVGSGADLSGVASDAIAYLISTQLANGSTPDDPYSTALALRGLAKANLLLTSGDIAFSNPTPVEGETVTISATIHNRGPEDAENVAVQFFDGDPGGGGVLIGECVSRQRTDSN